MLKHNNVMKYATLLLFIVYLVALTVVPIILRGTYGVLFITLVAFALVICYYYWALVPNSIDRKISEFRTHRNFIICSLGLFTIALLMSFLESILGSQNSILVANTVKIFGMIAVLGFIITLFYASKAIILLESGKEKIERHDVGKIIRITFLYLVLPFSVFHLHKRIAALR